MANKSQGAGMRTFCVIAILFLLAGFLSGCEGVVSGEEVARIPLQTAEGATAGAYAPVKFALSPAMNPLAFNFRADFSQNPAEFGKWNTYRATLTQGGTVAASRIININHPQSRAEGATPPLGGTVHTLFYVDVQVAGEYVLTIMPVSTPAITLNNPQADARRNVRRPDTSGRTYTVKPVPEDSSANFK